MTQERARRLRTGAGGVRATSTRSSVSRSAPTSSTASRRTSRSTRRSTRTSGRWRPIPRCSTSRAFEQFFEERRPFFLEGAGIFSFRTSCDDIDTRLHAGCSTRGASAARRSSPARYGDASSPTCTTIPAATKLTGRLANGLSIGVLDAVTQREDGPTASRIDRAAHELPRRARCSRTCATGRAASARCSRREPRRSTTSTARLPAPQRVHRRRRLPPPLLQQQLRAARDRSSGSARAPAPRDAIAALQRDAVHRYQRPDDDARRTTRRARRSRGDAQRVSFSKFGGGITRFQIGVPALLAGLRDRTTSGSSSAPTSSCSATGSRCSIQKPTKSVPQRASSTSTRTDAWTTDGPAARQRG